MKTIIKSALAILLGIVVSGGIVVAQDQAQSDQPIQGTQMKKSILTEEQKIMLKNDLQKSKELREAFKATLTQEQKRHAYRSTSNACRQDEGIPCIPDRSTGRNDKSQTERNKGYER